MSTRTIVEQAPGKVAPADKKLPEDFGICPFATAQKLLAGKWSILIFHSLSQGPKRFGELAQEIHATQATLSAQLKNLEHEGLIVRQVYAEIPPRVEYSLTPMGEKFLPVLAEIETWGSEYIAYLKKTAS